MDMAFWESKSFKTLHKEWAQKLKESDFEDIEDARGRLSNPDGRTNNVATSQQSQEFYSLLDAYLSSSVIMSTRDRKILALYSQGVRVQGSGGIMEQTGLSRRTIHYALAAHKSILIRRA